MLEKDICKHLDNIFNEFISKFSPEMAEKLEEKIYFAGGCIYCLCNDKDVKDYDMFMYDNDLIEELKSLEIWSYVSDYALTSGKFQLVTKYYGEPDECVGQFDFKHNMHYYIPFSGEISCAYEEELEDDGDSAGFEDYIYLRTNELVFNDKRARDLEGVYLRIDKFVKRGFTISKETKKQIKKRTTRKAVMQYKKSRKSSGSRRSYY